MRVACLVVATLSLVSACSLPDGVPMPPDPVSADMARAPLRELDMPMPALSRESLTHLHPPLPQAPWQPEHLPESLDAQQLQTRVNGLCEEIGGTLGSVTISDCLARELRFGGGFSVLDRPLVQRDYSATDRPARSRVLVLGGIHGDEYSSISIMFKWMNLLESNGLAHGASQVDWRFLPLANPDGLLEAESAVRQNANGVDLNRNFPSADWSHSALKDWRERTGSNPRRYPGPSPASEPEVQWLLWQIGSFQPDVIVSVHAPHHLLDYDGPPDVAPERIGELQLHHLGVYPGSLGNYAGMNMGMPVVTLELPSAGIMPNQEQIESMWQDLLNWLHNKTHLVRR